MGTIVQVQRKLSFWHWKLELVDSINDGTTARAPREALAILVLNMKSFLFSLDPLYYKFSSEAADF